MNEAENIDNLQGNGVLPCVMLRLFDFCYEIVDKYHDLKNGEYISDNKEFKIKKHNYTQKMYSPTRIHTPTQTIEVLDNLFLDTTTLTFMMIDVWLIHYYKGDFLQADAKAIEILDNRLKYSKKELLKNIVSELSKVETELNIRRCRSLIGA